MKKISFSTFLFFLSTFLLIFFVISPSFREIKKNSEALLSEREKMILLAKEKENLKEMKEILKTYQAELEKMENLFIDRKIPIEFINFLEKIAKESQAKFEIALMVEKTIPDPWPSLIFQINLESSFPNFLKFLEKLENSPYLIEIQNLNISRLTQAEQEEPPKIKAIFFLKAFTN